LRTLTTRNPEKKVPSTTVSSAGKEGRGKKREEPFKLLVEHDNVAGGKGVVRATASKKKP